jgi:iron complex transport system substrate-binding protein
MNMRIVSLLPSATEIVCELGLGDQLVGVSHECDFPPFVCKLPKVTQSLIPHDAASREIDELVREQIRSQAALYSLDAAMLEQLRPDVIVTQTLCNVCAVATAEVERAACQLSNYPKLVNLQPTRLADVFASLHQVAQAAGAPALAQAAVERLQARVAAVAQISQSVVHRPCVLLLEWIDPPFCSGHWSPELVELAGGYELIGQAGQPSRRINWEEVVNADPEVLVITCCGFDVERMRQDIPILAAYPGFADLACVKAQRVYLIDGSAYFNRPGPRLVEGLEILAHALHPQLHPLPVVGKVATRLK